MGKRVTMRLAGWERKCQWDWRGGGESDSEIGRSGVGERKEEKGEDRKDIKRIWIFSENSTQDIPFFHSAKANIFHKVNKIINYFIVLSQKCNVSFCLKTEFKKKKETYSFIITKVTHFYHFISLYFLPEERSVVNDIIMILCKYWILWTKEHRTPVNQSINAT